MRGLFHDFPGDPRAWDVDDQFLLGPDVLVAPVLTAGARERDIKKRCRRLSHVARILAKPWSTQRG
jgi:hypothetical protein